MRYMQLFENSDYNIARKIRSTLSSNAQKLLTEWEKGDVEGWKGGDFITVPKLSKEFMNKSKIAKEIWDAGQPIRDNIRSRVGDKITLYRGLAEYDSDYRPEDQILFSWTSSEKIARGFAGFDLDLTKKKRITRKEEKEIIKKFNERGFVNFIEYKFLKTTNFDYNEEIIKVYDDENEPVNVFSNIKHAISYYVDEHNEEVQDYKEQTLDSKIFKKHIPVNNIVWVLMSQNNTYSLPENEYIVLNYSK